MEQSYRRGPTIFFSKISHVKLLILENYCTRQVGGAKGFYDNFCPAQLPSRESPRYVAGKKNNLFKYLRKSLTIIHLTTLQIWRNLFSLLQISFSCGQIQDSNTNTIANANTKLKYGLVTPEYRAVCWAFEKMPLVTDFPFK